VSSLFHPLLAENALFSDIGKIFHPLFELFGLILAAIYSVIPNYGVAIAGLTVLIMLALTPVTIKSTKSMIAMQRLQPEMKKLQVKYKGPENREMLNQEMMKLYKENGTSPFGACLPSLLQMPFLIVLYSLIRGLSNTVVSGTKYVNGAGQNVVCRAAKGVGCVDPRYIPTNSKMHANLVASGGHMKAFGIDLSLKPLAHHSSWPAYIPYLALIAAAIFLQYYQMKQMNSRNPQAAAANPQMQQMQKFMPLLFGLIYLNVPAGATIYMVVSSAMRIGTQEFMFRTGMVTPAVAEREIGGTTAPKPKPTRTTKNGVTPPRSETGGTTPKPAAKPAAKKTGTPPKGAAPTNGKGSTTNGKTPTNGKQPTAGKRPTNGKNARNVPDEPAEVEAPKLHPRSRSKRDRKAR
jgi:YidC/Oxa1 family membrane protein insertase